MLQFLRIENLALLREAELTFDQGFTAVTGETGAGKSVLLGALRLLSGERAEKSLIAEGAEELAVEAGLFFADAERIDACLRAMGLPPCEDGALLIRRTLARSKMPRVQVNGSSTTVANLRKLGEEWIDFHGPGEPQKLFKERVQLEMLDLFGQTESLASEYQSDYRAWRELLAQIERLASDTQLNEDELAFLKSQIQQIDAAGVSAEDIEALETEYRRASNARELSGLAGGIEAGLNGDGGVLEQAGDHLRSARELAGIDPEAARLAERLDGLLVEMQDVAEEFGRLSRDADLDEAAVAEVEERMNRWLEVRRKFGGSVEAVLARRAEMAEKIDSQGDVEGRIEQLQADAAQIEQRLRKKAKEWTAARRTAAESLTSRASEVLLALGFKKAVLKIEILPEEALTAHGDSRCQMLFAPNPGRPPLPLNEIASSGETARVMLALKAVMASVDATPVLVFDEVDANVGGEIGGNVGSELRRLGEAHQVLCVTHLPQVAARARNHFVVNKLQEEDDTHVTIAPIHASHEDRRSELARMLGDRHAKSAQEHAGALLAE